jgi:hypothetical protein
MDTKKLFSEIRADMYRELGTHIVTKNTAYPQLWNAMDTLLRIMSFGKCKDFMKRTTTIGRTIAFPAGTDLYNAGMYELRTLIHEREHVKQFKRYTPPLMAWLYLFFPLPIGLAYFRYKFEKEAVLAEMAFMKSLGATPRVEDVIQSLSGSAYVWAWPEKWVRRDFSAHA